MKKFKKWIVTILATVGVCVGFAFAPVTAYADGTETSSVSEIVDETKEKTAAFPSGLAGSAAFLFRRTRGNRNCTPTEEESRKNAKPGAKCLAPAPCHFTTYPTNRVSGKARV